MSACGAPPEETPTQAPVEPAAAAPRPQAANDDRADADTLQAERAALQSQYDVLRIERDRLAGQVAAHQADGEKRLTELKAQWGRVDGGSREQLAEAARNELESALMMDEEYRAQLQEVDERLQQTGRELRDLRERETLLRK